MKEGRKGQARGTNNIFYRPHNSTPVGLSPPMSFVWGILTTTNLYLWMRPSRPSRPSRGVGVGVGEVPTRSNRTPRVSAYFGGPYREALRRMRKSHTVYRQGATGEPGSSYKESSFELSTPEPVTPCMSCLLGCAFLSRFSPGPCGISIALPPPRY